MITRISLCCYQLSFPGNWLEQVVPDVVSDTVSVNGGDDRWEDHGIIIQYDSHRNMTSFTLKEYFKRVM